MADATDNFNRASLGSNWTQSGGSGWGSIITSGSTVAKNDTASKDAAAYWNANTFEVVQHSQGTVGTAGNDGGPVVRHQVGAASFYLLDVDTSTGANVYRCDAGSFTLIGSTNTFPASTVAGDLIKLSATGTSLLPTQNGNASSPSSRSDATYSSGACGLHCWDTALTWTDWLGGPTVSGDTLMPQICL